MEVNIDIVVITLSGLSRKVIHFKNVLSSNETLMSWPVITLSSTTTLYNNEDIKIKEPLSSNQMFLIELL